MHFFILKGWILSNFHPSRVNYLHFSPLQDEFFAIFILKGDFFLIFTLKGWILCNFYPLRLNSLQFLSLKGEIFAIFTLRFFLGEKDKKLLLYWWILWNYDFYFSYWGFFYLEFWVCVVLTKITRFLLGDLLRYVQKCAHRRKWQKWRLIAKIAKL